MCQHRDGRNLTDYYLSEDEVARVLEEKKRLMDELEEAQAILNEQLWKEMKKLQEGWAETASEFIGRFERR